MSTASISCGFSPTVCRQRAGQFSGGRAFWMICHPTRREGSIATCVHHGMHGSPPPWLQEPSKSGAVNLAGIAQTHTHGMKRAKHLCLNARCRPAINTRTSPHLQLLHQVVALAQVAHQGLGERRHLRVGCKHEARVGYYCTLRCVGTCSLQVSIAPRCRARTHSEGSLFAYLRHCTLL